MGTNTMHASKKHGQITIRELAFIFILLCMLGYFSVLIFQSITLRHIVTLAGGLLSYLLAFSRVCRSRHTALSVLSFIMLFSIMTIGFVNNRKESLFEMLYSSANFLCAYVFFTTNSDFVITERLQKYIFYISIVITGIILLLSGSRVAYMLENGTQTEALTLGFTNPNLAGMMLAGVFNVLLVNNIRKHRMLRFFCLAILAYLIYLTEARSAMLCSAFVTVYFFFLSKKKIPDIAVIAVALIPVLFPFLYTFAYRRLGQFLFLGKTFFSGREAIYMLCFEKLRDPARLLFGNMGIMFDNLHNAPLSILMTLGVPTTVIIYVRYIKQLVDLNKRASTPVSRTAIVAILSLFLQSSAEAFFFTGVFPGIVLIYLYSVLAQDMPNQKNEKRV